MDVTCARKKCATAYQISDPSEPSPGGVVVTECPVCGEKTTVANPAGADTAILAEDTILRPVYATVAAARGTTRRTQVAWEVGDEGDPDGRIFRAGEEVRRAWLPENVEVIR